MGARCTRKCVCVCLSVFLVCTRVSVPKTSFNASDPTLGWAQWFLLCPVQGRVPVNLFLLVCCVYTKPVFLVLAFRCYKKKNERENEPGQHSQEAKERERERDPWSSACELVAAAQRARGRHTHMRVSNNSSARSRLLTGIGNKASLMTESNNYRWARCIEL